MEQWLSKAANLQYNPLLPLVKSKHDLRIEDVPDLREIIKGKNSLQALQRIQELSPQLLYRALQQKSLEDSLDILVLLSKEQFCRIIDYDVWSRDELVPARVFYWLELYGRISPKELVERFQSLHEEYQIASLCRFIRVYSQEEYEKMDEDAQDRLFRFPQDALFYSIVGGDENIARGIQTLIEACMAEHMQYVMALLAHAAYMPPKETEFLLKQFRDASLEEDGFVPYEESLQLFFPIEPSTLFAKWQKAESIGGSEDLSTVDASPYFLQNVLEQISSIEKRGYIQTGLLYLANALTQAAEVDSSDKRSVNALLEHVYAMVNLGLEYLSEKRISKAILILQEEYPKRLFQLGLGLIEPYCIMLCEALDACQLNNKMQLKKWYKQKKQVTIADYLDTHYLNFLGFTRNEFCKGVLNRLPVLLQKPDRASKSEDASYYVFKPIVTSSDLEDFKSSVLALCYSLRIVKLTGSLQKHPSLDSYLTTLFVRAVLYAEFVFAPVSLLELEKFQALDSCELQKGVQFFKNCLEKNLLSENVFCLKSLEILESELEQLFLGLKTCVAKEDLLNLVVSRLSEGAKK